MQSNTVHSQFISLGYILTNRLVLNLKSLGNSHVQHEASTLSSLAFATNSIVGNLGAHLRVGDEEGEDGELEELRNDEHELHNQNNEA